MATRKNRNKSRDSFGDLLTLENGMIVITAFALYYIITSKETYKGLQKLSDDNDPVKARYDYQAVSQESAGSNRAQYAKTLEIPEQLAKNYEKIFPDDLLPLSKEESDWSRANPAGKGSLAMKNMLSSGVHLGVNTQGSSLKNANLQLRSEPPNPILPVSIWRNSSVTPEVFRKQFEIGQCDSY